MPGSSTARDEAGAGAVWRGDSQAVARSRSGRRSRITYSWGLLASMLVYGKDAQGGFNAGRAKDQYAAGCFARLTHLVQGLLVLPHGRNSPDVRHTAILDEKSLNETGRQGPGSLDICRFEHGPISLGDPGLQDGHHRSTFVHDR